MSAGLLVPVSKVWVKREMEENGSDVVRLFSSPSLAFYPVTIKPMGKLAHQLARCCDSLSFLLKISTVLPEKRSTHQAPGTHAHCHLSSVVRTYPFTLPITADLTAP